MQGLINDNIVFVGTLTNAEDYAIRKNYRDLINDMPAEQVLDFMYQEKVVNPQQRIKISTLATDQEKSRLILVLIQCHPKGYVTLIKALRDDYCGFDWLADQICKDVEEFDEAAGDDNT